jgi:hypothetical protein
VAVRDPLLPRLVGAGDILTVWLQPTSTNAYRFVDAYVMVLFDEPTSLLYLWNDKHAKPHSTHGVLIEAQGETFMIVLQVSSPLEVLCAIVSEPYEGWSWQKMCRDYIYEPQMSHMAKHPKMDLTVTASVQMVSGNSQVIVEFSTQ